MKELEERIEVIDSRVLNVQSDVTKVNDAVKELAENFQSFVDDFKAGKSNEEEVADDNKDLDELN